MSNKNELENIRQIITLARPNFEVLAKIHKAVNFQQEASFAMQILQDNDYLASIALKNQDSLKRAVLNVAIIGLSLNPYRAEAYLIPRKSKVCLDISYKGYVKLAIAAGGIQSATPCLIRKKDRVLFVWNGIDVKPFHPIDVCDDQRGPIDGGYVQAMTPDGRYLMTAMSLGEIEAKRDRSESWIAHVKEGKKTPWKTDYAAMIKKTLIRDAKNHWPNTDSDRMDRAREVMEDSNPLLLAPPTENSAERTELLLKIRTAAQDLQLSEDYVVSKFARICTRPDVKRLEDMTKNEMENTLNLLDQSIEDEITKGKK